MGWQITFGGTKRDLTPEELEDDPFVSRWEGGKVVDLDELSPDVYDGIAADESGTDSWWGVYRFPCASASRMFAITQAAAAFAGVDGPSKPANMRESELILELFEITPDIADKPVVDSLPLEPPETEAGSSSGLQDVSGGDPRKSDENDSLTS